MDYISKKISKESDAVLKYLQAQFQLEKGEKVTEAEVIDNALKHMAEERFSYPEKKRAKRGFGLLPYAGFIKGHRKSREEDIDEIVYSKKTIGGVK